MTRAKTAGQIARSAAERRAAQRVLVDLEVDYRSEDTYLFASSKDISATGIFIRTLEPPSPGTHMNLRFRVEEGDEIVEQTGVVHEDDVGMLELEGQVIWVNPYRPDALTNLDPGMGVRFVGLRPAQRRRLLELIRRIAYID
jgi:c-di-GMP-binding flagellar brake protein YcgR